MIIQPNELTYEERQELNLKYDSEVPQSAIEDKIRGRVIAPKVLTADEIRAEIARLMDLSKWYAECVDADKKNGNEWMEHHDRREMVECLDKVTELENQLAALELPQAAE